MATRDGLTTLYPTTNAIFSPDDKYIVTSISSQEQVPHRKEARVASCFMRKDNLESVKELEVDTMPVKVYWHSKINQVR